MEFKLSEKEMYSLTRALTNIRAKLQTLESEMLYMPVSTSEDFHNSLSKYCARLQDARTDCTNAICLLNGTFPDQKLF